VDRAVLNFNNKTQKALKVSVAFNPFLPANNTVDTAFSVDKDAVVSLAIDRPQLVKLVVDSVQEYEVYLIPKDTLVLGLLGDHLAFEGSSKEINTYYQSKKLALGYYYAVERTYMLGTQLPLQDLLSTVDVYHNQELSFLTGKEKLLPLWFVTKERELILMNAQTAKFMSASAKQIPYTDLVAADSSLKRLVLEPRSALNKMERGFYNLLCYGYFKKAADINTEPYSLRYRKVLTALKLDGAEPDVLELFNTYWLSFMIPYTGNAAALNDYQLLWNELRPGFRTLWNERLVDRLLREKTEALQGLHVLKAGSVAPVIVGLDADGRQVSTADLKGKWVYVDLWATWCTPCLQGLKLKKVLAFESLGKDLVVLNVCMQSKQDNWLSFLKKEKPDGLNWFVNAEQTSKIVDAYQVYGFPHYVLIKPDGLVFENGMSGPAQVKETLLGLLK
jgi:thiol-disulfide isomerase/thioredoxin